jgi:HD-GYP domain-containing protein (c-di-GMP phosphodiesterase class II)
MKEKLNVSDIKVGMYIHDLDRPWLETPFLFQGFFVNSEEDIAELQKYCEYVIVDVEKSKVSVEPGENFVREKRSRPFDKKARATITRIRVYEVPVEEELPPARQAHNDAIEVTHEIFRDVRMGRAIDSDAVKRVVRGLVDSIMRNPDAMMLLSALKSKDDYSAKHSVNVSVMALIFGRFLGMSKEEMYELGIGALLHDIGETRIPIDILKKEGVLSEEEHEIMQDHTRHGREILEKTPDLPQSAIEIAYTHHERSNATGYPRGLPSGEISRYAMMVAIVDVYDAVTTRRDHRQSLSTTDALKTMYDWRDRLFDGELIEQFIQCLGIYPVGSVVELNSGEVGIVFSVPPEHRLLPKIMLVRNEYKKPYMPPKIIQLAQFKEEGKDIGKYEIKRVLDSDAYGIDLKTYLLRQLPFEQMSA